MSVVSKVVLLHKLRKSNQVSIDRLKVLIATGIGAPVTIYKSVKGQHFMTADDITRAKQTVKNLDKPIDSGDKYIDFVNGRITK